MAIDDISSEMTIDGKGDYILSGKIYSNEIFESFTVNPMLGRCAYITDTIFDRCKVVKGACMIMKGAVLKNVSFVDFNCGSAMHISSEAILDNVKIVGEKYPRKLWIRPEEIVDAVSENKNFSADLFLDITGFGGEVSITGLPASKIKTDPEKQVILKASLIEELDWVGLGLSNLSYWRILAKKTASINSEDGVYSIPPKKSKSYELAVKELKILRDAGLVE